MSATTARRPVVTRRRVHAFEVDWDTPGARPGQFYCLRCHLPGAPGDSRHPSDAPPLLPDVSDAARERDAAILGER